MAYPTEKLQTEQSRPAQTHVDPGAGSRRLYSVLVVDDEPGILSSLKKGLAERFSLVETAFGGDFGNRMHRPHAFSRSDETSINFPVHFRR